MPLLTNSIDHTAETLLGLLSNTSFLGVMGSLFIAYLGGILSSLTPCIYPMIPITISVVGGIRGKHDQPRTVMARGFAYVMGMAIIYAFLGVAAGITGKVFGTLTNTAGWYLSLGAIMTFASLMMMDVLPFDPQAMLERVKRAVGLARESKSNTEKEATIAGAFALGASSWFIAAPCTTPVLTAILGYIAQTQSVLLGLGLMLSFAFGLGTILMLIVFFAGKLTSLPKAGAWMNRIKIASGILILIFAQYLFFNAGKIS